ncbi:MAG: metalloregulator ArsR/SmtB family transcription factor [Gemmatimonadota bacterium]
MKPADLSPEVLELIAERFRVLGEPARLRILSTLMAGECSVTDLVDRTGLQQANVSKHLGVLRASGFVRRRKEGLRAFYTLADPSVFTLCEVMCGRIQAHADAHLSLFESGDARVPAP